MPKEYDINKLNLLVSQLRLKNTLKLGDKIYVDAKYLTDIQTTLKNHNVEFTVTSMNIGGYEVKIIRNPS